MGIYRTDYVMIGVDVGYSSCDYEKHIAEIEGRPDRRFDIVYDGMNSGYAIAGKILATSDEDYGFGVRELDPSIDRAGLAKEISSAFDREVTPGDLKFLAVSHFG